MNDTSITHKQGIPWHDTPKPRRWHRCWVQSRGVVQGLDLIERCPCGAVRINGGKWFERNRSRRRGRR